MKTEVIDMRINMKVKDCSKGTFFRFPDEGSKKILNHVYMKLEEGFVSMVNGEQFSASVCSDNYISVLIPVEDVVKFRVV